MTAPGEALAADRARQPHAILDRDSRVHKARKIVALVGEGRFARARRILEIGCGSGVIAQTLAALVGDGVEVHAVDVVDNRIERDGYAFQLVAGTDLPYPDGHFDLVVSNHVIEHVGGAEAQLRHLREIRRVLAPDGLLYLAVPNRWRLVEPHFRLPLLSWLPGGLADRYVRAARRGSHYDCVPLAHAQALATFAAAGFGARDATLAALRATLSIEHPRSATARAIAARAPDALLRLGMPVMPTFVFLLAPEGG